MKVEPSAARHSLERILTRIVAQVCGSNVERCSCSGQQSAWRNIVLSWRPHRSIYSLRHKPRQRSIGPSRPTLGGGMHKRLGYVGLERGRLAVTQGQEPGNSVGRIAVCAT